MKVVDFILERRMHDHAVVFMTCSSFIPLNPVGKIAKKNSLKEYVFVNSVLKILCHVVKNALLQNAFSAILRPLGRRFWSFGTDLFYFNF